jgi:hypothetical protein
MTDIQTQVQQAIDRLVESGAERGLRARRAGRRIAVELGAAGATVYVTGRSTQAIERGSRYGR